MHAGAPGRAACALVLVALGAIVAFAEEESADLLTLANGATIVSASSNAAAALALIDGNPGGVGWRNAVPKEGLPYTFVVELLAPTVLTEVVVDTAEKRPGGAVGAAAKTVEVAASAAGPDAGFAVLGTVTMEEDGRATLAVPRSAPVRWLRFIVRENHGNLMWTYLHEVAAFGEQTAVPDDDGRYTGVFDTNFGPVELRQTGAALTGCYPAGTIVGAVSGGVARLTWQDAESPKIHGTALFVVDSRGHLDGVQFRRPGRARWFGPRAASGVKTACNAATPPANPIAAALAARGEVVLYGLRFAFDADTLQPQSEPVLRALAAALAADPALTVDVEGHTDDVGDAAYNLALSRRRADAVVAWLAAHGTDGSRLHAVGKGEGVPVADNTTADGRAVNRRVTVLRRSS